jgi:hypothetical protein
MGAPMMDVPFVHARGVGFPRGVEVVRPEHDDEAVMVGAPAVGWATDP